MTTRDQTVYLLLAIAADKGEPCPSNAALGRAIGVSHPIAVKVVAKLEAQGLITVSRGSRTRTITIAATGKSTAPPVGRQVASAVIRRGQMAELVAEGWSITEAGKRMGLTATRANGMWQQIRADMGAQAV